MGHSIDAAHDPSGRVRRGHLPGFAREESSYAIALPHAGD